MVITEGLAMISERSFAQGSITTAVVSSIASSRRTAGAENRDVMLGRVRSRQSKIAFGFISRLRGRVRQTRNDSAGRLSMKDRSRLFRRRCSTALHAMPIGTDRKSEQVPALPRWRSRTDRNAVERTSTNRHYLLTGGRQSAISLSRNVIRRRIYLDRHSCFERPNIEAPPLKCWKRERGAPALRSFAQMRL
ncbi:hypothetical protein [Rhodoplanes sp. SY1]|uniref:hypothetical protein n=1 Tax=Rhodoplanes sp. SY1 TaxID=3166646 RepID=UPI0038B5DB18